MEKTSKDLKIKQLIPVPDHLTPMLYLDDDHTLFDATGNFAVFYALMENGEDTKYYSVDSNGSGELDDKVLMMPTKHCKHCGVRMRIMDIPMEHFSFDCVKRLVYECPSCGYKHTDGNEASKAETENPAKSEEEIDSLDNPVIKDGCLSLPAIVKYYVLKGVPFRVYVFKDLEFQCYEPYVQCCHPKFRSDLVHLGAFSYVHGDQKYHDIYDVMKEVCSNSSSLSHIIKISFDKGGPWEKARERVWGDKFDLKHELNETADAFCE